MTRKKHNFYRNSITKLATEYIESGFVLEEAKGEKILELSKVCTPNISIRVFYVENNLHSGFFLAHIQILVYLSIEAQFYGDTDQDRRADLGYDFNEIGIFSEGSQLTNKGWSFESQCDEAIFAIRERLIPFVRQVESEQRMIYHIQKGRRVLFKKPVSRSWIAQISLPFGKKANDSQNEELCWEVIWPPSYDNMIACLASSIGLDDICAEYCEKYLTFLNSNPAFNSEPFLHKISTIKNKVN